MKNLYTAFLCLLGMLSAMTQSQARSFSSITGNSIGSDQTICNNTTPVALTGSLPAGGTGVFTYQWQVSTSSPVAGFANIAGGTAQGYAPGVLTANRWYRRIVTSGIEKDTTGAVTITVTPIITAASNIITAAQTICFNTAPAVLNGPTATGGNGIYAYQWQSSPDNLTFTDIPGATTTSYTSPALTVSTWFRRIVTSGGCTSTSASIKITITPVITAGSNTISVDQSVCTSQTPIPLTGSTPAGATGTYTYLWESSTTSATAGFSTAAGTSNGKNYAPLALTQTTWFRRTVNSGGCSDVSSAVLVTVVTTPPGNPAVFGNGVWNVYGYSDNAFGTYAGYYTEPTLSFNTTSRYTNAQSPSYASGYQGCLIPVTNFSVSMKQTNFTPGSYQINLNNLDDNVTVILNGTQIYTHACCVAAPINNVWTGNLGASDQMEIRWTQATGPSYLSMTFAPVTPAPLVPGSINQNLQVCYGEAPPAGFTSAAPPTSGCTLTGMQWQKSIDSVTWVPIAGATALTYTETAALTQTTWYRRMVSDACGNALATVPVKVTVNVVAPGDPTVYGNNTWNVYVFQGTGNPGPFNAAVYKGYYTEPLLSFDSRNRWNQNASPSNASNYQGCVVNVNNTWIDYKRTNFTPAIYQIDIPYHDDAVYLFINGVQVYTHGGCCDAHTNVWTGPLGAADQVEMRVSQGGGPSYEMLSLTPVIPPVLTSGSITPDQTICAGDVPPTAFTQATAPIGGCTIKNYTWEYSTDNGATWTAISGATAISYSVTSSIYVQTLYRRTVNDVCGNSAASAPVTISMNNTPPGNPAVFGNNVWNVYCFQDVNYSIYAGYYTEPLLTFATTNRYPSTSPPSTASGYLGCQLINTYYSASMKRTGFTAGLYQIDVTSDDDYNLIYINGALVSSLNYPTIQNNVWTGNLGPTDQIEIRWRNNAGPGQTGVRFTLVTATPLLPGSIAAYNPNLCFNNLPIINEVTPASGGCYVNYSWQSSIDGGATWTTISGATGNAYTASVSPTTNIQYRRVATDVCGTVAYSVPVSFVQTAGTVGNPAVYGNGVWNVYAYDALGAAFSTAQYLGYYVEPLLSFNSVNRWGSNNSPSDASGYQGCQVDEDNHWVSYRQTNITPGTYQIDVTTHDDDAYLFINGVQVWTHVGCCDAHANVWTGTLGASDQVEFRWRENYGGSNGGLNFTLITPVTTVDPGTIASSQNICTGTLASIFTSTLDASSSCFVYNQWQSSPDNTTWNDIAGATSNVYNPGIVSTKTYYRRKATNACGVTAYSNTLIVDVYPAVIPGTISADQSFCNGTTAAALASVSLPTGGNGTYTYQWQSSLDNIGWSNIAGATATTYAPGAVSVTTYYRRNAMSCGTSSTTSSNTVTITVTPLPVITTQPGNPSACNGNNTSLSVVATGAGLSYQWQVNTGSGWNNVIDGAQYTGATTSSLAILAIPAAWNGYQYRVIVTGTCTPPVTSNIVTLTVATNPVITTQPANTSGCAGSVVNFNINASGSGITYQWQQKIGAGAWTSLTDGGVYSGTLTSNLTLTGVTAAMNGYLYRVVMNTTCAGTITSNQATLTVVAAINNVISADQGICAGGTAANLTGTTGGGYTYLWQSSTVSAAAGFVTASGTSNGSGYAPNPVSTTTYYRRVVNNGSCSSTSNVITITVNTTPISITSQPANQAICATGTATFTANANGPGTLTYQWYEFTGSSNLPISDGGIYSGATTNTLTITGATAGMNNYRYQVRVFSSGCSASFVSSNQATLTTNNGPVITANQASFTTCQGSNVALNITATGLGLTYQWQFNAGSGWNNLSNFGAYSNVNGNSLRINPTDASMDGYQYRCIVTGTCAPFTVTSLTTTTQVNNPVANNSISNSQTLCAGTPSPFSGTTPTGGTGTFTYQWYLNTGTGWFAIGGATGINYASGPLTQTTQFLRQVTSGACGAVNSTAITVTILPPTSTTDPGNTTVCAGTNATFTVVGTGSGLSYQWQVNTGSGWSNIINGASYTGATAATLNVIAPPFSFNGYQYRCIVNGGCVPLSVTSASATLTVSPVAIITSNPSNVYTCEGGTASYTVAATGTGLTYQWMEKVGAGAFTNITNGGIYSGATSPTLNISAVTVGMNNNQYQCVITAGLCPINSLVASLTVNAQPSLIITNPPTICAPSTVDITAPAVTAGSNLAGGILTYWNNITFTSPLTNPNAIAVSGTYYIRVATSPVCYDIKPVVVTITPTIINNNISSSQAICTGSAPAGLTGSAPGGGVSAYTYQWQQSTDNVTYSDIAGATNPNYSPGALTVTTWYRRVIYSGTCTGTSSPVQITVIAYPTANIFYTGSPFCATGTANVTQTGQTGGTYTAVPAGLSLNSATGAINLTASAANTYTVTYSFSNGTCNNSTTATVVVNALPSALISYPGTPYCATGTAAVSLTGTTGGTFSAPAGLSIDATTGAVNLATSTLGTYTVTYTFSNGTCSNIATALISINALPTAAIAYPGTPYCATGTAAVLQSGQTGGTYSSTAGLSINASTGAINLTASTASATPYTITYAFTNGTCSNSATTTVLINPLPTVVITNPAAVCSPGTVNLTAAAVTAGSTAGLTYTYFTDAAATSTLASPAAVAVSGTYYIKGTTAAGCTDIEPVVVTINPKPTVVITNPPAVCSPSTVDLTAAAVTAGSTAGLTYTYFTNAAGTTVLATPAAVAVSGTYYIRGTTAAGCSDIQPVVVTINPKPTVTITNPAAVCSPATVNITLAAVTAGSTAGLTYTYFTDAAGTIALATPAAVAISGTYYIKGTTAAGCSDIKPVVVTINPKPTVVITNPPAVCSPSTVNLTAAAVTAGSTAGLTYTYFTNAAGTTVLTGPAAVAVSGTYYIKGTTASGCSDIQPVVVTINPKPTVTITNPAAVCAPGTVDITLSAVTAGSTAGLTYTYFTDAAGTIALATPTAVTTSGTYYIKGTTASGCSDIKPVVVTINPKPAVVITNPAAVCSPSTVNLTAAAVTAGSTAGLTFTYFTNAAGTTVLAGPAAVAVSGTYYIKGTTAAGCSDIQPVVVTINPKPSVVITNPAAVCSPATVDLTAAAVTTGSTAGLTFTYFTNAAGTTVLATPAAVAASGTYYIKGTTAAGCSDIQPVIVTINPKPTVTITNPAAVCSPATVNITLAAVTAGSTAGLTYTYFTDAAGTIALATPAAVAIGGTYYIKGTTAAGCSDIKPVVVTINPKPTVVITDPAPVCSPATVNLTVAAVTAGSTAGLTYTYFTNAAGTTVLATPAAVAVSGTYYIKGTTAAGCSDIQPVVVTINPKPTVTITNPAAVCAPGTVDITAAAVTAGSTAGLTYTYFTDAAGTIVLATPAAIATSGTYYIRGTTAAGCSDIKPVVVTINPKPTVVITNPAAVCSPATVNLTLAAVTAGSTAGLTYTYFTNAAGTTVLAGPAAVAVSGTYYIKGTTAAGCSDIQPVVVTINPKPTVVITNPAAVCSPSTVDLTAAAITTGSTAGLTLTYFTNAAGTTVLAGPAAVAVSGTYYIKGTTASGCSDIQPVVVTINPKPTVTITNPAAVCSPATVNLTLAAVTTGSTAGLTYTYFTDAAGTIALATPAAVAASGTYYIKGTTAAGCSDIKPVTVTINAKPTVVITDPAPVCSPGTVNLTAAAVTAGSTAGLTYTYFTNAAGTTVLAGPATVAVSGTYYIKGTTASGCSDIQPVVVTISPKPTVTITNPAAVCSPATVNITLAAVTAGSTAGLTYTYFTNAAGTTVLAGPAAVAVSGTYYIKGTTASGCSDIQPVVVTINPKPTVTITNPAAVCSPGTVNITVAAVTAGSTAGLTYTYFTDAAGTIALATPAAVATGGTYYIKGTTASGCSDIKPVVVTINALPTASISYTGTPYCATGTATVTLTGTTGGVFTAPAGVAINASSGDINLAASTPGINYVITYTFSNGTCSNSTTSQVTINALPTAAISYAASPYCATGTATVTQTGQAGGTYSAAPAGLSINAATGAIDLALSTPSATAYTVTYSFGNGTCNTTTSTTITINAKPTVAITNPATVCSPGTVDITAAAVTAGSTAGLTYTYFTNAAGTTVLASPNAVALSGTYYIKGTTASGCSDIQPVVVTINPKPTVVITNPAGVCAPSTVDLTSTSVTTGSTAGLTYTYFTNAAGTTVLAGPTAVAVSGTYYIKGTIASGCSDIQPVVVTINPKPTVVITNPVAVCSPATVNITLPAVTTGSTAGLTYTYFTDAAGTIALATPASVSTSGTYYIKGSTAAGCSDIKPVVVTINALPTATISYAGTPYCATGTASATITGTTGGTFTAPAGVSIDAVTGAVNLATSTPGINYLITYTFSNGTCSNSTTTSITINALPTATISYTGSPYCATGTATVTQTGQNGGTYTAPAGLSINASTGAINLNASTPSATPYTVTYTFTNGTCSNSATASILVNALPTVVITNPSAVCSPSTVDITPATVTAGSTTGLTYTYFTDAAGTIGLASPAAIASSGTYYIKGTSASACSDIKPVVVTINPKPTVTVVNPAAVCSPATVDITSAAITAGSTAGLTYSYFTDAAGTIALATPAAIATSGTYYIKGTTAAGCSDIRPVIVTINALPTATISYTGTPYCATGIATVTLTGQTGGTFAATPAGLSINGTTGAVNLATSVPGAYTVTYSFTNGTCNNTYPASINIITAPSVIITNPAPACNPATVDLTAASVTSGSTAGLTYSYYTDAAATITLSNPNAVAVSGTYYIKGSAGSGCSDVKPVVVTINPKPVVVTTSPAAVCSPLTVDITAAAVTAGSTAGLTYTYFTDAAGTIALATPAAVSASGTYYIKGTLATGCSDIKPVVVTINPKPAIAITNPAAVCSPLTVDITAAAVTAGSTAGLTYTYFTDAAGTIALASPTTVAASGTYYIKGTLATGCSDIQPVVVTINPKPAVAITNPAAVCSPLTVDITAAAVTAGSTAGLTYSYFTDAAGTIVLPTPSAVATGGTYYIKGTTASGCSDIQPIVVTINPKPTVVITNPVAVCSPGTVDITAASITTGSTAGLTYTYFSDAAGTIALASPNAVSIAGTYYIKGVSASGCSDIKPVVVTINALPAATISYTGTPYCATGTATVTLTGTTGGTFTAPAGVSIDAITGTINLASSTAGINYIITYTFSNGTCSNSTTSQITINALPTAAITYPGSPFCASGTVNVTQAGQTGGTYAASPAGLSINTTTGAINLAASTPSATPYTVTYSFGNGTCNNTATATVIVNAQPTLVITNPAAVCSPATVDITSVSVTTGSTAGLSYTYFTDAAGTVALAIPTAVAAGGTYYIKGTTASGCSDIKPVVVTINPKPTVVITNPAAVCSPGTIDITAGPVTAGSTAGLTNTYFTDAAGTIVLTNPNAVATSGTYYIMGSTAAGCSDIKPVVVTINALPTATISYPGTPYCATGIAAVTLTGQTGGTFAATPAGLSLNITTGAVNLATSIPGTYTVTYSFTNGTCSNTYPTGINIISTPAVVITNPAPACTPSTVDLTLASVTAGSTSGLTYTYFTDAAGTIALATPAAVAASGTYYIKGSAGSGCFDIQPVLVTINPKPTVVITNPTAICSPATVDITATAVTAGSTGGLTYTYFTDAAGTIALGSPAAVATSGTYYIKGTTASGCSDIQPVVVTINALPSATIAYAGTPYCAAATATVTLTGTTGGTFTAPAGVVINAATGDINLVTSIPGANYIITYTFSNGTCSNSTTTTITINALPTAAITYAGSPYCATGTATVTLTGQPGGTYSSAAGLSINASTGDIDLSASTPSATPYTITYSFGNGTCSNTTTTTVLINSLPTVVVTNPAAVCSPATVDITAAAITGGSTAGLTYTYFTDAAGTIGVAAPAAIATSGTYYIKGTTASGCSDIKPVVVTINPKPTVVITNPAAVCSPLTVDITAAGITAGSTAGLTYTYFTDAAGTIALATPAAVTTSGTYYVQGTTASGCSDIQPVVVTINPKPTVVITNPPAACPPSTVDITAASVTAGSTTGLTYSYFSDAATTVALANANVIAIAGTYYIKGMTAAGCSDIQPVVVSFNALPIATIDYPATPYCATGLAAVTLTGQTGGTFTAPAAVSIDAVTGAINLAASTPGGPYTITYTFSNGTCSNTTTANILINALPTATIVYPASPYCATGLASVTQTGQTGGTYSSSPGLVLNTATGEIDLSASTPSATPYLITYTFGNGTCTNTTSVSVTINPLPLVVISNPATVCAPATVDLTAAAVTAGSAAGLTYSYFTDAAGTIALANANAVSVSGTYYIKGTAVTGCSTIQPVVITINAQPAIAITDPAPACSPATVDITAAAITAGSTSGLTYTYYQDAAGTIVLAGPNAISVSGTYYIRGTAATGCSDISPVTVTINPKPVVVITNPPAICAPAGIDLTAAAVTTGSTAGLTFTYFSDAAGTIALATPTSVTVAGTYYIKGTTAVGCSDIQPVVVSINAQPVATISYGVAPFCATGTAAVTITGQAGGFFTAPAAVSINGVTGSINLASTIPGNYTITYTFSNGTCSNSATASITVNPVPLVVTHNPAAVCAPLSVNLTLPAVTAGSTPGLTYTYFRNAAATIVLSNPASVITAGTYYIKGTNGTGCVDIKPVVVTINPLPLATITYTGTPYCKNGTAYVSLTGTGSGSFVSSPGLSINAVTGDINLAASTEGTYMVVYSFTNGTCSNTTTTMVTIKNPALVMNNPPAACFPMTVNLTDPSVTAGSQAGMTYNYYLDNAGTVPLLNPSAVGTAGTYFIKGVDMVTGCSSNIGSVVVTINPKPTITASPSSNDICKGTTITLTAVSPGNTLEWLGIGAGPIAIVTPTDSTTYYAVATTSNGCKDTTAVDVAVKPFTLTLTANPDPVLAGTSTTFTTTGNFTYDVISWSPDILFTDQTATSQTIVVNDTTKSFTVIAKSTDGCMDTATLDIVVDPNLKDFFIPNAFSPNNDGNNDILKVYGTSVKEVTMRVYNQWGELIFESQNMSQGWDGTWKGRPQAVGVYVYVAKVTFYNNVKMTRKGTINLIR